MAPYKTTPVPVVLFAKDAKIARAVKEKLLPDYDVVDICHDAPSALSRLPALFSGKSGAGAAGAGNKTPRAVFFGGNFSSDEYNAIVNAVKGACGESAATIQFVKCQKLDVISAGYFGPSPAGIAKVFRKKMAAAAR